MHAKIENNQVVEYPVHNLRQRFPNTSFPSDLTKPENLPEGYVWVKPVHTPTFNQITHKIEQGTPVLVEGEWVQTWNVVDLDSTTIEANQAAATERLMNEIVEAVQQRLDDFARTKNYDGILSACTYATSSVVNFQIEGQYAVEARDATWATLYQILAEVQAGQRPVPTSYADIEPSLPTLEWPA